MITATSLAAPPDPCADRLDAVVGGTFTVKTVGPTVTDAEGNTTRDVSLTANRTGRYHLTLTRTKSVPDRPDELWEYQYAIHIGGPKTQRILTRPRYGGFAGPMARVGDTVVLTVPVSESFRTPRWELKPAPQDDPIGLEPKSNSKRTFMVINSMCAYLQSRDKIVSTFSNSSRTTWYHSQVVKVEAKLPGRFDLEINVLDVGKDDGTPETTVRLLWEFPIEISLAEESLTVPLRSGRLFVTERGERLERGHGLGPVPVIRVRIGETLYIHRGSAIGTKTRDGGGLPMIVIGGAFPKNP